MNNDHSSDIIRVVSFGATLASIILSILAIFITVTSNNSILKARDGMDNTTEAIKNTIQELNESRDSFDAVFENNLEEQKQNINEIHSLLKTLRGSIDEGFERNSKQLKDLAEKLHNPTPPIAGDNQSRDISTEILDNFIRSTSVLSLEVILMLKMIIDRGLTTHGFLLSDIARSIEVDNGSGAESYILACLVLFSSFGLLNYQLNGNEYSFTSIHKDLADKVIGYLQDLDRYDRLEKRISEYLSSINNGDNDSDLAQ